MRCIIHRMKASRPRRSQRKEEHVQKVWWVTGDFFRYRLTLPYCSVSWFQCWRIQRWWVFPQWWWWRRWLLAISQRPSGQWQWWCSALMASTAPPFGSMVYFAEEHPYLIRVNRSFTWHKGHHQCSHVDKTTTTSSLVDGSCSALSFFSGMYYCPALAAWYVCFTTHWFAPRDLESHVIMDHAMACNYYWL